MTYGHYQIWREEEVVMAYFKVLFQHSLVGTEENHETLNMDSR
jgi:hypothetical protein